MAILYALVARGSVVLAEFSVASSNAGTIARRLLENLAIASGSDTRLSFAQDRYVFHIMRSQQLTFLCMANDTFGRRLPFAYLEDIQMRFTKTYGQTAYTALAYAMNDEFSRVLHQQMEYFSSNPNLDTLNRAKGEMNEVRSVMVENIDKVLDRGERINLLVDKTATMQDNTFRFRKQSRRLQQALWMKNAKLMATLAFGGLIIMYFIIAMACGGLALSSCRS